MIEQTERQIKSRELAVKLYDTWVRERQKRPDIRCTDNEKELKEVRRENFLTQVAKPRQRHLDQLKRVAKEMTAADKVALLVMMELPAIEISTLLHRLGRQIAESPDATYFSLVNQRDNCGSGCG